MQRNTSEMPISKIEGKQRFGSNVCFEHRTPDK